MVGIYTLFLGSELLIQEWNKSPHYRRAAKKIYSKPIELRVEIKGSDYCLSFVVVIVFNDIQEKYEFGC